MNDGKRLVELLKTAPYGTRTLADCFFENTIERVADHLIAAGVSVNAVDVVRCRECKYNTTEHKCLHPDSIIKVPKDNDYCSYGERGERDNG